MLTVKQVGTTALNIRTGPGTAYKVDHIAHEDDMINVDTQTLTANGFVKLDTSLWTAWQYLRDPAPVGVGTPATIVNTTKVNVRSGPGTNHNIVGALAQGAAVSVDEKRSISGWYRLAVADPQWVSSAYVQLGTPPIILPPVNPSGWTPPMSAVLYGGHLNPSGNPPSAAELDVFRRNRINYTVVPTFAYGIARQVVDALHSVGVQHIIVRAAVGGGWDTATNFIARTLPVLREWAAVLGSKDLMLQVGNEVNLTDEGWTHVWKDGYEFTDWFLTVTAAYRAAFPGCRIGFAPMSPGGDVPDLRMDEQRFIAGCAKAIQASDFVVTHCYWAGSNTVSIPTAMWRSQFGGKSIVVGETGPGAGTVVTNDSARLAHSKFAAAGLPAVFYIMDAVGQPYWTDAGWVQQHITV